MLYVFKINNSYFEFLLERQKWSGKLRKLIVASIFEEKCFVIHIKYMKNVSLKLEKSSLTMKLTMTPLTL